MREELIIVDNFYDNPLDYHRNLIEKNSLVTEETVGKISQILKNKIKINQLLENQSNNKEIFVNPYYDWIGVVYLSIPLACHGNLGVSFFYDEDELEIYSGKNISQTKEWKQYGHIPVKYNRLVLFRGNRWHSYFSKNEEFFVIFLIENQ